MALKHFVHLLERHVLSLGEVQPDPDDTRDQKHGKEDVRAPGPGFEHGRYEERNGEIVSPIGSCTDRGALGTDGEGEDFGDECPGDGAPCCAETSNVDPD